jgi:hypothetical protein
MAKCLEFQDISLKTGKISLHPMAKCAELKERLEPALIV